MRVRVRASGVVQGVGLRPFVFNLAVSLGLAGWVRNDAEGLTAEVEGEAPAVLSFVRALQEEPPPLAVVESLEVEEVPELGEAGFRIVESQSGERRVLVSPDVATCPDCLREVLDPEDRRFRYPFTNCTNCGPRYTIVKDVPYDRERTTMSVFPMCPECEREYHDPRDRRFHAQPNACPACGPHLSLLDSEGRPIPCEDPIGEAARLLVEGGVVAVKGLGGYHLACDAANEEAVSRLRSRKHREDRPFALMAPDLEAVRALALVGPAEEALLLSRRRPIVLLKRREGAAVAPSVAPRYDTLGIMLPYTPLHHLLLAAAGRTLVMTSGNLSDEPIAYKDDDALRRLSGLADAFLIHDREIWIRCDDSVTRVALGGEYPVRRSRGYAPEPIHLPLVTPEPLVAVGAELKNTVALVKEGMAFVSHHIGDLENYETLHSFEEAISHLSRLFDVPYRLVVHDLHPEYLSTKWAEASGLPRMGVQHHHAHIASCLAENGTAGPALGVAFDGLGYGGDGTLWGGEFLLADLVDYSRLAHLKPVPLPGGTMAIKQPWRMAAVWLERAFGEGHLGLPLPLLERIDPRRWRNCLRMAARGVNSPLISSVGRLFDAVAALAGIREEVTYEGQAAVELEVLSRSVRVREDEAYPFCCHVVAGGGIILDPVPAVEAAARDVADGSPPGVVGARFHLGLALAVREVLLKLREETGQDRVALSGGVFQNLLLLDTTVAMLEGEGFRVLLHRKVPANDGGICLGQAAVAAARLQGERRALAAAGRGRG